MRASFNIMSTLQDDEMNLKPQHHSTKVLFQS